MSGINWKRILRPDTRTVFCNECGMVHELEIEEWLEVAPKGKFTCDCGEVLEVNISLVSLRFNRVDS